MEPNIFTAGTTIFLEKKKYLVEEGIKRAGSSEVYNISSGGMNFALKIYFPFYKTLYSEHDRFSIDETLTLQAREYKYLSQMSHPNIVRVTSFGMYKLAAPQRKRLPIKTMTHLPFIIEDLVEGVPIDDAIDEYQLTSSQIVNVLLGITEGLQYIHEVKEYMHVDIKSSNVLVRRIDKLAILVDFGLAKNLDFSEVDRNAITSFEADWDLFPSLVDDHPLKKIMELKRGKREEIFKLAFPALDLFDFGLMIKKLIPKLSQIFDHNEVSYLTLLVDQLTNWEVVRRWSTKNLRDKVSRLSRERSSFFGIPELTAPTTTQRTIMIPPGVSLPLTDLVERIIENRSFRRLAQIHQLSLISMLYPAADYKRIVHVLFAYHLGREFLPQLYSTPYFRLYFDAPDAQRLLATILLHDINHFPFLHTFQEAQIPKWDTLDLVDHFCDGDLTGEKALGSGPIKRIPFRTNL